MKNFIFTLLFVFTTSVLTAQDQKDYKSFYKTFKKEQNVFGISAPLRIANLFIGFKEKEIRKIIRKGKKVKILIFSEGNSSLYDEIDNYLPSNVYENHIAIKDEDARIKILIKKNEEKISEIIVLIKDNDSFLTVGIYGNFTYSDLGKLYEKSQNKKGQISTK